MHVGTRLVLVALGALLMPHFAAAQDEEVELNISNQTPERMTVFALWESGTRVRLGDLNGNQTRRFTMFIKCYTLHRLPITFHGKIPIQRTP